MFFNYLKILLRNLLTRKTYTIVNILGLAIGLTSFILIMMYVLDELSYDRYHRDANRIQRLCMDYDFGGVGENSASMPFPVAFTLKNDYPDMVEEVVRLFNFQSTRNLLEYGEHKFNESRFFFADSTFFEIFDYEFIQGNPATALDEPFSVVITESMARKYFGDSLALNKTLKFESQMPLKVTGIIMDVPFQSHFTFDFIASMSSLRRVFGGQLPGTWVWNPCWTYIRLAKGVNPSQLEDNFQAFIDNHFDDAQRESITMYLQPLTDIHLKSRLDYEIEPNSNHSYVVVLSVIAIFLLLIAAINFMNLATATSSTRAREIGIRKATGANRIQLVMQFLGESLVMTFFALIASLILIELLLPYFNDYTGKHIRLNEMLTPEKITYLVGLWLLLGMVAGIYPAFYLSSFRPISVLKGNMPNELKSGLARKILVVFQFTISISLIIVTIIIFRQVNYMRNADLGFNPHHVIMVPVNRTGIASDYLTFKNKILEHPNIVSVTAVDDIVGSSHNTHEFWFDGMKEGEWRFFPALVVQHDFLKTFEIKLVAGRDYNFYNKTDPMEAILVNEALVKHMGWTNEEALGKTFRSLSGNEKIIGVFSDFQATSLREPASPFVLNMKENQGAILFFLRYLAVKTDGKNDKEVIAFLEKEWGDFEKNRPFDYTMLDDSLRMMYKDEASLGVLALIFTALILFVAGMGLFGLASFMAEKRTKEIGIRKVMGATVGNIVILLIKEFARLVVVATLIAWPLAYFLIDELFLSQFALQVPLNVWIFLLSGLSALFISVLIISYRALSASMINPAETLKYE